MNDVVTGLLWIGGPALIVGGVAVMLHTFGAVTRWQRRRTVTVSACDTPKER